MVHLQAPTGKRRVHAEGKTGKIWRGLIPLLITYGATAVRDYTERTAGGYCTRQTARFGVLQYRNEPSTAAFGTNTLTSYQRAAPQGTQTLGSDSA